MFHEAALGAALDAAVGVVSSSYGSGSGGASSASSPRVAEPPAAPHDVALHNRWRDDLLYSLEVLSHCGDGAGALGTLSLVMPIAATSAADTGDALDTCSFVQWTDVLNRKGRYVRTELDAVGVDRFVYPAQVLHLYRERAWLGHRVIQADVEAIPVRLRGPGRQLRTAVPSVSIRLRSMYNAVLGNVAAESLRNCDWCGELVSSYDEADVAADVPGTAKSWLHCCLCLRVLHCVCAAEA